MRELCVPLLVLLMTCAAHFTTDRLDTARSLIDDGRFADAVDLLESVCTVESQLSSVVTDECLFELGTAHLYAGAYDKSVKAFQDLVHRLRGRDAVGDPILVQALESLATALEYSRSWDEALGTRRQVIQALENTHGAEHRRVAVALCNAALASSETGDIDGAVAYLMRGISMASRFDASETTVAGCAGQLAVVQAEQGRSGDAERYFELEVTMLRKSFGQDPAIIPSLCRYADFLRRLGRVPEAEVLANEAGEIAKRRDSCEHHRRTQAR